jgi:hypothetical protein
MSSNHVPVKLEAQGDEHTTVTVMPSFTILGSEIGQTPFAMEQPGMLHFTVTPPRRKLSACKWLLQQLTRCIHNEASALIFLELLVTELRSSTFTLQKLCAQTPGFDSWYQKKQELMASDEDLRWVVQARNAAQKQGTVLATWGPHTIVRFGRNGRVWAEMEAPLMEVESTGTEQLVPRLQAAIGKLDQIIEEAHQLFVQPVERQFMGVIEYVRERADGTWEHFDLAPALPTSSGRPV